MNLHRRLMLASRRWLIKTISFIHLDALSLNTPFDDMRGAGEYEAEEWI